MRGDLVSRPLGSTRWAKRLKAAGVNRIIGYFHKIPVQWCWCENKNRLLGRHAVKNPHASNYAEKLGEMDMWIRLHYVYPLPTCRWPNPMMGWKEKILPYLDISPFQHANKRILTGFDETSSSADRTIERIRKWREICSWVDHSAQLLSLAFLAKLKKVLRATSPF